MKLETILIFLLIALNWILTILLVAVVIRMSVQIERLKWQPYPKVTGMGKERKNKLTPTEVSVEERVRRYKSVEGVNAKVVDSAQEDEDGNECENCAPAKNAGRTNRKNRKAVKEPEGKTSKDDV